MADHKDKRSVHTDALATLGTIIGSEEKRDAIHIAVEPAQAVCKLHAGDHVGRVGNGYGHSSQTVGIVDPFLTVPVMPGDWFWLLIYPRQITSLRHVWSHPSFPEEHSDEAIESVVGPHREKGAIVAAVTMPAGWKVSKAESEMWLRNFCDNADCPGFDSVMRAIEEDHDDDGDDGYYNTRLDEDYLHFGGSDAHGDIPSEFWDHYRNFTGKEPRYRAKYFSCSC